MKKIIAQSFVLGLLFVAPLIAFAHGGAEDGDGSEVVITQVATPDPEQKMYVAIGVGVTLLVLAIWFFWSKMKSS